MTVRLVRILSAVLAAVVLAACGSSDDGGGGSAGSKAPSDLVPSALVSRAQADPTQPYPSQEGDLPTVRLALSVTGLQFAAYEVASKMNFFGYQGVKIDFQQMTSDSQMAQSIIGNSTDLGIGSANGMVNAVNAGAKFQAIMLEVMQTAQVCVRKDWAAQRNVTRSSPLKDRIAALKGAAIGITAPKSSSDTIARLLLSQYGGLDPDRDVRIITVGSPAADTAGIDANRIQAFAGSAPICEQSQQGMVLIRSADVPGFENYINEVVYGNESWVNSHQNEATRVATALAMGANFVLKYPDETLKIEQAAFPKLTPDVVNEAFTQAIAPYFRKNGTFEKANWDGTMDVLKKLDVKPITTDEGQYWTNQYINLKYAVVH